MTNPHGHSSFATMNRAYNAIFGPGRLSIGLVAPIAAYQIEETPSLEDQIAQVQLADALGFAAIWLRDIPFNVPSFGDVGQMFDPFVYLGALATSTKDISLGIASAILPLRHPAHVAKSVASVDVLSGGRMVLGVASGDRPEEYPAMAMEFETRGDRFRDSMAYMRAAFTQAPKATFHQGHLNGHLDMLPKPVSGDIPMLITGRCQQTREWVAEHGDGWITFPRSALAQARAVADYRDSTAAAGLPDKPVMQSLYIDLLADPNAPTRPIHLGFQCGAPALMHYLTSIEALGVNHVAINLRFNTSDTGETMRRLAGEVLPEFAG